MKDENITTKISVFNGRKIRKTIHNGEWWFVIEDIVLALIDSKDPKQYIKRMKLRDPELRKAWVQIVPTLDIETDGGLQKMNCANTESVFRIIQSIPSKRAEPFKRWLAYVGYERIKEIENPELSTKRTRALYKAKGYSDAWIEKRMRGIEIRETLTDEWRKHGVKKGMEYSILTSEISKATFDMTPLEYKKLKGLKRENLRDHMNDLELIFTMLGEVATTEIIETKDARGFHKNKVMAQKGGKIAGDARKELEKESGRKVSTPENYLQISEQQKRLKSKLSIDGE